MFGWSEPQQIVETLEVLQLCDFHLLLRTSEEGDDRQVSSRKQNLLSEGLTVRPMPRDALHDWLHNSLCSPPPQPEKESDAFAFSKVPNCN